MHEPHGALLMHEDVLVDPRHALVGCDGRVRAVGEGTELGVELEREDLSLHYS